MSEVANCPSCNQLFMKTAFRSMCDSCRKEEDRQFDLVYSFMRKRENRMATSHQITEATGVTEEMIFRFVKQGRLQITKFPNLGYPCDQCGALISQGKICDGCRNSLQRDLTSLADQEKKEESRRSNRGAYHTKNFNES